jgi:hypothetical protein
MGMGLLRYMNRHLNRLRPRRTLQLLPVRRRGRWSTPHCCARRGFSVAPIAGCRTDVKADLEYNQREDDALSADEAQSREGEEVQSVTYDKWDDCVDSGVLPVGFAQEGYERCNDSQSIQCTALDDDKYNGPVTRTPSQGFPHEEDPPGNCTCLRICIKRNPGKGSETRMCSPEQMTLVAIVSEKYAVIQGVATWKMLVPGCALAINELVTAPTTRG